MALLNQIEDIHVDKDDVEEKFKQRLKDQDTGFQHYLCIGVLVNFLPNSC